MKRSARAVLKEELSALRKELRAARRDSAAAKSQLVDANTQKHRAVQDADRYCREASELRSRINKAYAWANQNRPGDLSFRALTEYIQCGPTPLSYGAGGLYVNPFDRWQVSPAIR